MKLYNEDVMKALRQTRNLEPDDKSLDEEIMKLSKRKAFEEYCRWNGFLGSWDEYLLDSVESIFNVKLTD